MPRVSTDTSRPKPVRTLIGRLAVAKDYQGRGLGAVLLAEALRRAHQSANIVGSCMVVVDAIDEAAARFYSAHDYTIDHAWLHGEAASELIHDDHHPVGFEDQRFTSKEIDTPEAVLGMR